MSGFPAKLRIGAVGLAVTLTLSGLSTFAQAEAELPASALAVRSAVMAISLADAALPAAIALGDDRPAIIPVSSAAMKPETSGALAAMKTASVRSGSGYVTTVSYDRRVRSFHAPFPLILGIAY